jgi:uncharacterized protein YukE
MIDIFGTKVKKLEKEVTELKEKLADCSDKLEQKQEQINKTNAFWKKKLWEATKPSKKKS